MILPLNNLKVFHCDEVHENFYLLMPIHMVDNLEDLHLKLHLHSFLDVVISLLINLIKINLHNSNELEDLLMFFVKEYWESLEFFLMLIYLNIEKHGSVVTREQIR